MSGLKSMTGYGSCEHKAAVGFFRVFLKSVNRKGLDIALSLPDSLREFENEVREWISAKLHRGTLSLVIEFQRAASLQAMSFDEELWMQNVRLLEKAKALSGWSLQETASVLAPQLAKISPLYAPPAQEDRLGLASELKIAFDRAFEQFDHFREKEGLALATILREHILEMRGYLQRIEVQVEGSVKRHSERLQERLKQLDVYKESDPHRWAMEVAILADRMDIREEIDRLKTHFDHFEGLLRQGPFPIGRKLDFLTQEMMRESNTLMSKSQDIDLSRHGIELKSTLERLREQLQNLE